MKFRYAILYVSDVRETVAFYQAAFGLECAFIHECGDYAELATGETKLAIASREMIGRLGKSPAAPMQEPRHEAWGQVTSYVRDRDGFLIELCSVVGQAG